MPNTPPPTPPDTRPPTPAPLPTPPPTRPPTPPAPQPATRSISFTFDPLHRVVRVGSPIPTLIPRKRLGAPAINRLATQLVHSDTNAWARVSRSPALIPTLHTREAWNPEPDRPPGPRPRSRSRPRPKVQSTQPRETGSKYSSITKSGLIQVHPPSGYPPHPEPPMKLGAEGKPAMVKGLKAMATPVGC